MVTINVATGSDDDTTIFLAKGADRATAESDPDNEALQEFRGGNDIVFYPDSIFVMVQKSDTPTEQEELVTIKYKLIDAMLDDTFDDSGAGP